MKNKIKISELLDNRYFSYFLPIILLFVLTLFFGVTTGGTFLRLQNLEMILNQSVVVGIVATGAVLIYSSGNMNIAMGGSTAITCIAAVHVYLATGSILLMFLASVLVGIAFMGMFCVLSEVFKLSVVIITVLFMTMLISLQEWLIGGATLKVGYDSVKSLQEMNVPILIFAIYFIICLVVFQFTKLGRTLKFIGENKDCARQTGIKESAAVTIAFLLSGLGVGLGAFSILVRASSVGGTTAGGLNMEVVLAIVLAGTPMTGGNKSKIFSGVVGAVMVTMMNNGLLLLGVNSIYIQAIRGMFFIIMVMLSGKRSEVLPVKDMV